MGDQHARQLFSLLGVLPAGLTYADIQAFLGSAAFDAQERLRWAGLSLDRHGHATLLPPVGEYARRYHPPENAGLPDWHSTMLSIAASRAETKVGRVSPEPIGDELTTIINCQRNTAAALRAKLKLGLHDDVFDFLSYWTVIFDREPYTDVLESLHERLTIDKIYNKVHACNLVFTNIFLFHRDYDKASEYASAAAASSDYFNDKETKAYALRVLGRHWRPIEYSEQDIPQILEMRLRILDAAKGIYAELDNLRGVADCEFETAAVMKLQGDRYDERAGEQSTEKYKEARAIYMELGVAELVALCEKNIAYNYAFWNIAPVSAALAIPHLFNAVQILAKNDNKIEEAQARYDLGQAYSVCGRYDEALSELHIAKRIFTKFNKSWDTTQCDFLILRINHELSCNDSRGHQQ